MFGAFTRVAGLPTIIGLGVVTAMPSVASAGDDHRFATYRRDDRRHHIDRGRVNIEIEFGRRSYERVPVRHERVWTEAACPPVVEPRCEPPVYRTVIDRVWVEPVTRTVHERVWVPDRYEWRETVCWERGRRVVRRERVLVECGHFETVCREVVLTPGYFREYPRLELSYGR